MDDELQIRRLIRQKIAKDHSKADIFYELNPDFEHNEHDMFQRTVPSWFNQLAENDDANIPQEYQPIIKIIHEEFEKCELALERNACPGGYWCCHLAMLSERYSLDLKAEDEYKVQLYLCDMLYGQKRPLQAENTPMQLTGKPRLIVINSEYFLLLDFFRPFQGAPVCRVNLMHLNLSTLTYTLLDSTEVNGVHVTCVFDTNDSTRFLFYTSNTGADHLYKIRLLNEKLDVSMVESFGIGFCSVSLKYEDGTIYGIHDERRVDQDQFFFKELTPNSELKTICEVEIDTTEDIQECLYGQGVWIENCLYYVDRLPNGPFTVFKLDVNEGLITEFKTFELPYESEVRDVKCVDGVLSICASVERRHLFRRIPLTYPDKLFNLAMETIRKSLMFAGKEQFESLVQNFPPKLRPFEQ